MHDAKLLQALLDSAGTAPHERDAFRSMAKCIADGRSLSFAQRAWAQDVGARLGLSGVGAVGYTPPSALEAGPRATARGAVSGRKVDQEARALDVEIRLWNRIVRRLGGNSARAAALLRRVRRMPAAPRPALEVVAADPERWE
jgi:hypothetical protein